MCGTRNVPNFPVQILFETSFEQQFYEKQLSGSRIVTCLQTRKNSEDSGTYLQLLLGKAQRIRTQLQYYVIIQS
jgi:hypothetical protein